MLRIFLVGVAIVAVFVFAKRDHWWARTGLVGTCQLATAPAGDKGQWWSCREGILSGYPTLTQENCDSQGVVASREFWRCPTPLEQVPGAF
jgi:hypothetical protein